MLHGTGPDPRDPSTAGASLRTARPVDVAIWLSRRAVSERLV